ncbi:MAG: hypothetical protein AA908_10955 [Chlorobi bacterium NICIL-2]|nr:MAG: hypothetical protein AA908_10955 [Chlorobi bacterium NICIL-2]
MHPFPIFPYKSFIISIRHIGIFFFRFIVQRHQFIIHNHLQFIIIIQTSISIFFILQYKTIAISTRN